MTKLLRTTLLAFLLSPIIAAAQPTIGLRVGYALPSGDLQKDLKLSDQISSQVPIQLDLMYRLTPQASAGVYVSYGFDQVAQALKDRSTLMLGPGASYSATTLRAGVTRGRPRSSRRRRGRRRRRSGVGATGASSTTMGTTKGGGTAFARPARGVPAEASVIPRRGSSRGAASATRGAAGSPAS
jgi:hypothetical protein